MNSSIVTGRKVRKDFDRRKEYSVDVSNCTEDEKKEVQQAFFDAGFVWESGSREYRHLHAVKYTNTTKGGRLTKFCMYGLSTKECNMTPDMFFSYVYEPVQQGHPHADLMAQYAEDARVTDKPWELWQVYCAINDEWFDLVGGNPAWNSKHKFRRKPKTHTINGYRVPAPETTSPEYGERYYTPILSSLDFYCELCWRDSTFDKRVLQRGLVFLNKEDTIANAKAILGIDPYNESEGGKS